MNRISFRKYVFGVLVVTSLFSCKENNETIPVNEDQNTLNYLIRDNFTLSFFAVALHRTGIEQELAKPGPFTVLMPSDDAFKAAGFSSQAVVSDAQLSNLASRTRYHLLPGELRITDQPLGLNTPWETVLGTNVYLSRMIKGLDTLTTINGARILSSDTEASNGIMQVVDRFLAANIFDRVGDALSADMDLSLFYQALKRSGLLDEINSSNAYTLYAPNNAAVQNYGYANLMEIEEEDPDVLRDWLQYHIAKERKFAQDYFLLAGEGVSSYTETMLDERELSINLLRQNNVPNSFTGITIRGLGNTRAITLVKTDILAGNGVIHVIGEVLR